MPWIEQEGWPVVIDVVERGVLSNADATRFLEAVLEAVDADSVTLSQGGGAPWRRVANRGDWIPPDVEPSDLALRDISRCARWHFSRPDTDAPDVSGLAWGELRSIDGPVHVALFRGPGARAFDDRDRILLRMIHCPLERVMQRPRALSAIRGEAAGERGAVLAGLPHALIVGSTVTFSDAAIDLFLATLGSLAGRSVQRLQRAVLHAAAIGGGEAVPLIGDLRVDFRRVDEGVLAIFRRAHVPTLHGHWRSPAEQMLSPRQQQVARLVMEGCNLHQIATSLDVQAETARGYLKDVYRRLGVRDRGSLAAILRF